MLIKFQLIHVIKEPTNYTKSNLLFSSYWFCNTSTYFNLSPSAPFCLYINILYFISKLKSLSLSLLFFFSFLVGLTTFKRVFMVALNLIFLIHNTSFTSFDDKFFWFILWNYTIQVRTVIYDNKLFSFCTL